LSSPSNGADYVLIAPDSLLAATQSLADYRATQKLDTKVVALGDIYNEFNYGNASPHAIREFLSYALKRWRQAPSYVTLVGRGTLDYKNYRGYGDNLMPPLMAATPSGLFVSDARIADVSGNDGVPEIAIGRIPVLSSAELLAYLAKVQAVEQQPTPTRILMAADNPDAGGSFNTDSDAVAALVPASYSVVKVYLNPPPTVPPYNGTTGKQAIIDSLYTGVLLFNYIGHGGFDRLADEGLLLSTDVPTLTNPTMPIFLGMTCAVGNFGLPGYPSLAEKMLLKQGGGIYASWAATGLAENSYSVLLDKAFFTTTFSKSWRERATDDGDGSAFGGNDRTRTVGDVIVTSLRSRSVAGVPVYMRYLYNLLGEPVSRLP
jgi:hypothetical protein